MVYADIRGKVFERIWIDKVTEQGIYNNTLEVLIISNGCLNIAIQTSKNASISKNLYE